MRSVVIAWLVAAALLARPGGAARAADDPAVQEARTRFQAGVQLFHEGSFDAALAEFRKAYQLAPSFRVLYNIAQVQFELRDYVGAWRSFRQYLAEGGGDVPADRRAHVDGEVQKLERRIAVLEISSNVDGAELRIDDVPVGTSPLPTPILVNAGLRRISAAKPGRVATARSLTVAGGDRVKVTLDLPEVAATAPALARPPEPTPVADRPRTKMWVALAVTAGLGVATGTLALLTRQARNDFESKLDTFPSTLEDIDRARRKMVLNAAITDGLAGATLLAAGVTVYFAVSRDGGEPEDRRAQIRLAPGLGGLTVYGSF
jgi:hypothetical protein